MFTSIAIIGRPNVGKSTLFNKLTRSRKAIVSDFSGLTKDRNHGYITFGDQKSLIIDTGGIAQDESILKEDIALLILTHLEPVSYTHLTLPTN